MLSACGADCAVWVVEGFEPAGDCEGLGEGVEEGCAECKEVYKVWAMNMSLPVSPNIIPHTIP